MWHGEIKLEELNKYKTVRVQITINDNERGKVDRITTRTEFGLVFAGVVGFREFVGFRGDGNPYLSPKLNLLERTDVWNPIKSKYPVHIYLKVWNTLYAELDCGLIFE